jgi:N-acetyl-anhydromuramyl-L-alanine amidase AmpD
MQPGEHLAAARSDLATGQVDDALRHAQAITKGPEAPEARAIEAAIGAALRQARQQARLVAENRKEAVSSLQSDLKNRGYDLTVSRSDKPDEITIVSKDFGDTDHRVLFLSFLRGRNSPASQACVAGF